MVDEYHRRAEAGIFTEDDRVERIKGKVVTMSPIGSRHAACINRLNMLLSYPLITSARQAVRRAGKWRVSDRSTDTLR